jgi:two-component system response regulator YesN
MLDMIQLRYADVITLRTLGKTLERQPAHLGSLFRREVGISARECLTRVRLARATELILTGVKIEAVALIVGYRSKKNFYRQFKRHFATTPEGYRMKVKAADIVHPRAVRQPMLQHFGGDRGEFVIPNP